MKKYLSDNVMSIKLFATLRMIKGILYKDKKK